MKSYPWILVIDQNDIFLVTIWSFLGSFDSEVIASSDPYGSQRQNCIGIPTDILLTSVGCLRIGVGIICRKASPGIAIR